MRIYSIIAITCHSCNQINQGRQRGISFQLNWKLAIFFMDFLIGANFHLVSGYDYMNTDKAKRTSRWKDDDPRTDDSLLKEREYCFRMLQ